MGLWAAWPSGRCPGLWLGFVMDDHFQAKPIYDLVLLPRFKLIMNFPSEPPLSSLSLWPPVHVIIVLHSMSIPHNVKEYKSKETKAAMGRVSLSLYSPWNVFSAYCVGVMKYFEQRPTPRGSSQCQQGPHFQATGSDVWHVSFRPSLLIIAVILFDLKLNACLISLPAQRSLSHRSYSNIILSCWEGVLFFFFFFYMCLIQNEQLWLQNALIMIPSYCKLRLQMF